MKKFFKVVGMIALLLTATGLSAQMVTLTFTAMDADTHYVQLSRVEVTNLVRDWQEILYWPDTTLVMQVGTGISDMGASRTTSLQLSQNNPNPFKGYTEVDLAVVESGNVVMEITDLNGRVVGTADFPALQSGVNRFRVSLTNAGTYVLNARQNSRTSSVKMVCTDGGGATMIESRGVVEKIHDVLSQTGASSTKSSTSNPFEIGDTLYFKGYSIRNGVEVSCEFSQVQETSQENLFLFAGAAEGQPCPATPTVTDHEGNVYNTVQIGLQCWTRENMRCTTSPNGYLAAGGNAGSSISPYYYDNLESNVPLGDRGLLYNWPGAMDTTGHIDESFTNRRGICPQGWHVPSDQEWTKLVSYVSSQGNYYCDDNIWFVAKALASTNYWSDSGVICAPSNNPSENNATGFSIVPTDWWVGYYMADYPYMTLFWSSTLYPYNGNIVLGRRLEGDSECLWYDAGYSMSGFSVRCLRDY